MKTVEIEKVQKILNEYIHHCDTLDSLINIESSGMHSTGSFQIFTNHGSKVTPLDNELFFEVLTFLIERIKERKSTLKQQIEKL